MTSRTQTRLTSMLALQDIHSTREWILNLLALYVIPAIIFAFTLISLTGDNWYNFNGQQALTFSHLEQQETELNPKDAFSKVQHLPLEHTLKTRLTENPIWFLLHVPPTIREDNSSVEFPSRHARNITCWDTADFSQLGSSNRDQSSGKVKVVKAGFSVDLGQLKTQKNLLCKTTYAGSANISANLWPQAMLEASSLQFHRDSGLLDGGLIVLTVCILITAAINRESLFVLFAIWLITNLRAASLSAGWDMQWLGQSIPAEWHLPMRKLTLAAAYILMIALFSKLFSTDLKRIGHSLLLQIAQWSCLPMFVLALTLTYAHFLPFLWAAASFAMLTLALLITRIILATKSRTAMLYGCAFGITVVANFAEIIAAATGFRGFINIANSVTSALFSSLVIALAIAEQFRLEHQAKISAQAELKHTYEAIPIGLFTLDEQGVMISSNPALQYILNIPASNEAARNWRNYFDISVWEQLSQTARTAAGCDMEVQLQPKSGGGSKWLQIKATFAQGKIEGSLQDVTVRHIATEKLKLLADHDPLTGIFNRRGIERTLQHSIESIQNGESIMVGYLDLDRFKLINDLYGHVAGDDVLKQVCHRLLRVLGDEHVVGRIGGDEFIIIFKNVSVQSAETTCERVLAVLETHPYLIREKAFQVKASIGLVELSGDIQVKDAISSADRACREAKHGLHGHLLTYEKTSSVFRERESELAMIERFSSNRAPDGLFLEMQPIMSLRDPFASHNFETLIRMREPDGSIIPAGRILAAAESNGNSGVIDRWVLTNILQWLDIHLPELKKTRFVCMNLSGASLNDERFIQDAFSILSNHPDSSARLCIEITEDVALNDLAMTRRFIDGVKKYDAKIALDDFGAGYTSFSYLRELPADAIKIDGSFVRDVCKHPTNLSIVSTIAELAKNLGMKSIAEWAEDLPSVEALAEVGVDYVQGWAIAKAQSPENILRVSSSADLILDETMAKFVRENLPAKSQAPGFLPFSLH